jgi:hypothetical protein
MLKFSYRHTGYEFVNEFPDYFGFEKGDKTAVLYYKRLK